MKQILLILVFSVFTFFLFGVGSPTYAYTSQPENCVNGNGPGSNAGNAGTGGIVTDKLQCPATFDMLQSLGLRFFVLVDIIIGFILLFSLIKSGFAFMNSFGDAEKKAAASKGLRNTLLAFVGIGIAYMGIILIGTLLLSDKCINVDGKQICDPTFLQKVGNTNKLIFDFSQYQRQ